jgi:hypothetical protein
LCNSIAKVRKIKNIWYFNCNECNKVVNLDKCFFICSNLHCVEPYKFNDSFNCDNTKFNYITGSYSYKSCFLCTDKISIEQNKIIYVNKSFYKLFKYESTSYYSYSPFTFFDTQDDNHLYITVNIIKQIAYLFLFNDNNYKQSWKINIDTYDSDRILKTIVDNFKNNSDMSNDQMVNNVKWENTQNNLIVEFIKENKMCKLNDKEYFYSNINPHTSFIIYEKTKLLITIQYKWIFMLNTHLDKIVAIQLKNNVFNSHYILKYEQ